MPTYFSIKLMQCLEKAAGKCEIKLMVRPRLWFGAKIAAKFRSEKSLFYSWVYLKNSNEILAICLQFNDVPNIFHFQYGFII